MHVKNLEKILSVYQCGLLLSVLLYIATYMKTQFARTFTDIRAMHIITEWHLLIHILWHTLLRCDSENSQYIIEKHRLNNLCLIYVKKLRNSSCGKNL